MTTRQSNRRGSRPAGGGDKIDVYQLVTDQVIKALEAGTVPWHKPWSSVTGLPLSVSSRKPYRGVNVFLLGLEALANGYASPWWATFNKIAEADGVDVKDSAAVRGWAGLRGQRSTLVVFWKRIFINGTNPDTGKPERRMVPFLRYFRVFNADQVTWTNGVVPKAFQYTAVKRTPVDRIDAAEKIIANYPNPPQYRTGNAAYYQAEPDLLTMPPMDSFDSAETYYSTKFHELTHSTGHDSRLARDGIKAGTFGGFGSAPYSKEELVAEMGAAMLSAVAGLENVATLPNSAAYVASWLSNLRGDAKLVVQAAAQAQRAVDHVQGVVWASDDADEGVAAES